MHKKIKSPHIKVLRHLQGWGSRRRKVTQRPTVKLNDCSRQSAERTTTVEVDEYKSTARVIIQNYISINNQPLLEFEFCQCTMKHNIQGLHKCTF